MKLLKIMILKEMAKKLQKKKDSCSYKVHAAPNKFVADGCYLDIPLRWSDGKEGKESSHGDNYAADCEYIKGLEKVSPGIFEASPYETKYSTGYGTCIRGQEPICFSTTVFPLKTGSMQEYTADVFLDYTTCIKEIGKGLYFKPIASNFIIYATGNVTVRDLMEKIEKKMREMQ